MKRYDVIVVGGGPAGLAFARALSGSGLRLAVVERQPRAMLARPADDGREIALTHRSVATLGALGAWERIDPAAIAPLREARVLNGASPFALNFDTGAAQAAQLGHLVSNHRIREALFAALPDGGAGGDVDLLDGTQVAGLSNRGEEVTLDLAGGGRLAGRLLVGADSRFSSVREGLGIAAQVNRLGRAMLVCRVAHEGDHEGIATEWFDYGQTIAMLPLNGRMSSAVLTLPTAQIERLAALGRPALGDELTRRYGGRLGAMSVLGDPHVYPLAITWSRHFAARRAALIGDAAVGMHPVTAHGFNLGLQSAMTLATCIREALLQGRGLASDRVLRQYERAHRLASRPIYTATNMLVGLYTAEHPAARAARHATLRVAASLPYLRHNVSRLLMQP